VKARQCPDCHGRGGYIDIIADGQGPLEPCGFCKGTGQIRSKRLFYQILGWRSAECRYVRKCWDKMKEKGEIK